jgi:hypothetical protein
LRQYNFGGVDNSIHVTRHHSDNGFISCLRTLDFKKFEQLSYFVLFSVGVLTAKSPSGIVGAGFKVRSAGV